ncbi:MAG TPA: TldD/PmbA family protein [Myxococcota bacterium]|nr:TldD/PmbA family protein [Myxococcota bacterium]
MSKTLLEQAREVVVKAQKLGAQGVRTSLGRSRNSEVEWRDGKLDRLRESTSMSIGITLYVDGRYSSNSSSDLRPEAIDSFLKETVAMTRVLAKDQHRKLPDPGRFKDRFGGDLKIFDEKGSAAVTAVDRRKTASDLEAAARSGPKADQIISVTSSCSDTVSENAKVTSNGMEGSRQSSTFVLFTETSVKDEGGRKPEGWHYAVTRHRGKLPGVETIGGEATRRAFLDVGAKPEKSGQYTCVIENRVAGQLLGGLLSPLSGSAIQQKRSFLADKLGQEVLGKILTITDDPFIVEGLGSRTYDEEGMSLKKMPVFEKGVLRTFYLDTYYASKLGMEPTTGGQSNLVFSTGNKDLAGLLKVMGKGILVTGFSGGNSNSATGDFSIGIRGQWIENGKIVRPVAEMNMAGNHLKFWKKLAELGGDPHPYSSWRTPSLRFGKIQFSGV